MNDTTREMEKVYRYKLMEKSASERFIMGCRMFDSALGMIQASFRNHPTHEAYKVRLFRRLYGSEFSEQECRSIEKRLDAVSR